MLNECHKRITKMKHRLWWSCQRLVASKLMGDANILLQTEDGESLIYYKIQVRILLKFRRNKMSLLKYCTGHSPPDI
jgi:hypothetical protein